MADQPRKQPQPPKKPAMPQKPPVSKPAAPTGGSGYGAPVTKPMNPQSGQK